MAWCPIDVMKISCMSCGSKQAYTYMDQKYHGLRGACLKCQTNWPES